MVHQSSTQAVLAATVVGAVTIFGYYYYKKARRNRIPTIWEPVGKISDLYMYPLKSGRRLEIESATCTEYGLQSNVASLSQLRDRCLVIYKEGVNEIKTARTYPKILLIETTINDEGKFTLNAPGMDTMIFEIPTLDQNKEKQIVLDNEQMHTLDCGDQVAQWISQYVLDASVGLRLGFHDGQHRRNIEKQFSKFKKLYPQLENYAGGMYSDTATALIMTKSSVNDLVKRIPNANVTIHNFRPNIVIDGDNIQPYAEDNWDWIKIGDAVFRNVMLCPRCALTTINPEAAEFSKDYEPIKTMKTYRSVNNFGTAVTSPDMGIYAGLKREGQINVGDMVYVGKH